MGQVLGRRRFVSALAQTGATVGLTFSLGGVLGGCRAPANSSGRPAGSSGRPAGSSGRPAGSATEPRLIIIQFGGGTRSSESIDDPEHRWIPRLWQQMVPRGTLFTNMRVEGKVVHPNSTGSMVTGHWEWEHLDWTRPVSQPTVFEVFRKQRGRPDTEAWAFVYASILAKVGFSTDAGHGPDFAANVVVPPTIARSTAARMERVMQEAAATGSSRAALRASRECAELARSASRIDDSGLRSQRAARFLQQRYERWKKGSASTSHDAFLADCAIACMKDLSPAVIFVGFGEIDCAHYGSWSRYVDAIRRTDELTWRIWQAARSLPAYRDQTLVLILPDHGRELDRPGHYGFIHHSDFYTDQGVDEGCRRVWMLALGPGVAAGGSVDRPVPITAAAATGLDFLRLPASRGASASVLPLLA